MLSRGRELWSFMLAHTRSLHMCTDTGFAYFLQRFKLILERLVRLGGDALAAYELVRDISVQDVLHDGV